MNKYLSAFFVGVRKSDGTEYEPCYLKNIQCSLERHLRKNKYSHSITEDTIFFESRELLKAKQKDLKKQGKDGVQKLPIQSKMKKLTFYIIQIS